MHACEVRRCCLETFQWSEFVTISGRAEDTKKMDNKAYIIDEGATKGRVHLEDKM